MNQPEKLACTLGGPELVQRYKEWSEVAARATSRHAEKGRIVSTYPRDPQLLNDLRRLIAAEADCCTFMTFNVTEREDDVLVELSVPDEMGDALALMLGIVTPSREGLSLES